jgi:hypothetical protein
VVGAYPERFRQPDGPCWTHSKIDSLPPADRVRADIGIVPVDTAGDTAWRAKSENPLTLKTAAALPIVAPPVPSYESVIEQGRNGCFAHTRDAWLDCFERRRDPALRGTIGEAPRRAVLPRFSIESQAAASTSLLQLVVGA